MTAAGTGHAVTSSALKVSLVKTARKCVLRVKTATTVTPSTESALTVTPAGLGTGTWPSALLSPSTPPPQLCFARPVAAPLTSSYRNALSHAVIMFDSHRNA